MHDDYETPADNSTELAILLDGARRLLRAIRTRETVPDGENWLDFEADQLGESLHHLFGDPMPAPVARPAPAVRSVVAPSHRRRFAARRHLVAVR